MVHSLYAGLYGTSLSSMDRQCMHGCPPAPRQLWVQLLQYGGHELCTCSSWLTLLLVCVCRTSWTASEASLHLCDSPLARTGLLTMACQTMLEMVHVLKQCLAAIWSRSIFSKQVLGLSPSPPVVCLLSDHYYHQYPEEGSTQVCGLQCSMQQWL